ncbi:hypothetical protein OP10G_1047 [Fimbriimonas ginsengisoli Gsoil 348]|uniref:Uncharacterized protein n=1 Tax=Fimbriimonas ginsengisoli Gsoil 348 TaxID=661478 RepID=A0A068NNS8_FIMGI|nr:hypothetical protein OP10G_1047 [Fimbriimonas ginsengisoli Gsoil 348]
MRLAGKLELMFLRLAAGAVLGALTGYGYHKLMCSVGST